MLQKRKKVLFVLNRGWSLPSARVRGLQYREMFDADPEWEAEYIDICSGRLENWVSRAQALRFPWVWRLLPKLLRKYEPYWSRKREEEIVARAKKSDLVYFLKISDVSIYKFIKKSVKCKILMDLNDGLWLPHYRNSGGFGNLEEILNLVDAVVCENRHTASYAAGHNQRIFLVPDAPPLEQFEIARRSLTHFTDKVVIGWVGSPLTVRPLVCLLDTLEKLASTGLNITLHALGCSPSCLALLEHLPCRVVPEYDEQVMIREVSQFDIGLFPLSPNQDALARGIGKAMIYMAARVAVVAQNYGEITSVISDGKNGVLAGENRDWFEKIQRLASDGAYRGELAQKGLETASAKFSKKQVFGKLLSSFNEILALKS